MGDGLVFVITCTRVGWLVSLTNMFDLPLSCRDSAPDSEGHALTYTSLARYNNERDDHRGRSGRGRYSSVGSTSSAGDDNYNYYYDHSYNQERIWAPPRPHQTVHHLPPWLSQHLDHSIHTLVSLRRGMGEFAIDDDIIHTAIPALREVAAMIFGYVYDYLLRILEMD